MPRTAADNAQIKDERREQILHAARRVFAQHGYAATKMAQIAAAAGVSHGLVYHYFPGKEATYVAVLEDTAYDATWVTEQALARSGTAWERLTWLCDTMLAGLRDNPEYGAILRLAGGREGVPPEVHAHFDARNRQTFANLASLIAEGQAAGQVVAVNPRELAITFLACIHGIAAISSGADAPDAAFFPHTETVLRLLRA